MKFWKLTLITVCSFFAISATVLVSSCEKDACTELKCKNGSACTEGFCRCQTGYEGAECEIKISSRFVGTYIGYNHCGELPSLLDTLEVREVASPNVVECYLHNNNPGDVFRGTVDGYTLTIPDFASGAFTRRVNAVVDHNQITLFVERNTDVADPGFKSVCTFVGTKK